MEIALLLVVMALLAAAVGLYRVERERGERALRLARGLERVARDLTSETDPLAVLRSIPESALAIIPAEYAALVVRQGDRFEIAAGAGLAVQVLGTRRATDEGVFGDVLLSRQTVSVADYQAHPRAVPAARDLGLRSVIATPILVRGELAACLVVGRTEIRPFDDGERHALEGLAAHASIALANAQGRERAERRVRQLTALNDAATRLADAMTADRVARVACETAGDLVRRDAFYVARYDPDRKAFHFILQWDSGAVEETALPERWDEQMVVPLGDGPTSRVVLTGLPYVVRAGEGAQHSGRAFGDQAHPSASAVHVPLRHGERIVGVLSAQSYTPNAYDDEDVRILQSLADLVAGAFEKLWQLARLRDLYLATVRALAAAVDARDPYTRSHSARVSALARVIAEEMRLPADEVRRVQLGALLHDIGKIGIPDAILNKPAALAADEWVVMRTHPSVGAAILESVEPLADLVPIVRDRHERYAGKGYPAGLEGGSVDITAYIVAVADAYEVIVSKRSYKEAQSVEFAMGELRRCRGTQFHPAVTDAFLGVIERDLTEGTRLLARVGAIEQEEIEDVPGPSDVLQRYVAISATHGRRLAVLQRLASEFGAVLDLDELAGRLLRIICDAMGYEYGFLTTLDRDSGEQVIRAAFGPSYAYVGTRIARGTGISSWVLEHGKLQNVGDVTSDPRFFGPPDVRSNLIVPLRIEAEVVGVIGIESPRPSAFTIDDEQLLTAVSHQIAAAVRVANLHRMAKQAAATDPLTGLANRRAFFERLEATLASSANDGNALTVALVDVDDLKKLNDEHGHHTGDEGLTRVGELLVEGVRSDDVVARIGGDEFAILFVGAPIFIADRALRRVAERLKSSTLSGGVPAPSVSWGVAQATGPATSDRIIETADRAMYRHKSRSRTRAG